MFKKILLVAALLVGQAASAELVTIQSNYSTAYALGADFSEDSKESTITSLPSNQLLRAQANGTYAQNTLNFGGTIGPAGLTHGVDMLTESLGIAELKSGIGFSVSGDTTYSLSGALSYLTNGDISFLDVWVRLMDTFDTGTILFEQKFYLGQGGELVLGQAGFGTDWLAGSLTGQLFAGHQYFWEFTASANSWEGYDAVGGSSLLGSLSLEVPEPASLALVMAACMAAGATRRRSKKT